MRRWAALLACAALAACAGIPADPPVVLATAGPPLDGATVAKPWYYELPAEDPASSGGSVEQFWSMVGREDRAASFADDEYRARPCRGPGPVARNVDETLEFVAARARETRIVIVNESHHVTRHRDFTARLAERLKPEGYRVFAAETFLNVDGEPDPVDAHGTPWPTMDLGHYSAEPVFGRMLRRVTAAGYRLAAYEEVHDDAAFRTQNRYNRVTARESAQAKNLAAILAGMEPGEKLLVHAGYAHASEEVTRDEEDREIAYMAARLARQTGIDPLTIDQTTCRGGSADDVLLHATPQGENAPFDLVVDHPVVRFVHGRAAWRFTDGYLPTPVPPPYDRAPEPLVIEVFREGEPFDAVPDDRLYVEPGEDAMLVLRPGRYTVRAIRPVRP